MTDQYRQYRGLLGETIRVPERTLSQTTPHFDRGAFPFVETAQRMGKDRDKFALIAMTRRPFYEDAARDRTVRALAEPSGSTAV